MSKSNNKWNPISYQISPRIKTKMRKDKKKYGFFSPNFLMSTGIVVTFFLILFIPNYLGFEGFFGSGSNADFVAYNVENSSVVIDGVISDGEYASQFEDPESSIKLYAEHNTSHLFIAIECNAKGWCAIGFNDETFTGNAMVDSDIKMGYVDDSSNTAVVDDRYATSFNTPEIDDETINTIGAFAGTQGDTNTIIELVLILDVGDSNDKILEVESSYTIIYAQGDSDEFIYHGTSNRGFTTLTISEESDN